MNDSPYWVSPILEEFKKLEVENEALRRVIDDLKAEIKQMKRDMDFAERRYSGEYD